MLHEELTQKIIKAFYEVHNTLGFGFLEQVYQNALYKELCRQGMKVECQKQIRVFYKDELVGHYVALIQMGCINGGYVIAIGNCTGSFRDWTIGRIVPQRYKGRGFGRGCGLWRLCGSRCRSCLACSLTATALAVGFRTGLQSFRHIGFAPGGLVSRGNRQGSRIAAAGKQQRTYAI